MYFVCYFQVFLFLCCMLLMLDSAIRHGESIFVMFVCFAVLSTLVLLANVIFMQSLDSAESAINRFLFILVLIYGFFVFLYGAKFITIKENIWMGYMFIILLCVSSLLLPLLSKMSATRVFVYCFGDKFAANAIENEKIFSLGIVFSIFASVIYLSIFVDMTLLYLLYAVFVVGILLNTIFGTQKLLHLYLNLFASVLFAGVANVSVSSICRICNLCHFMRC